MKHIVYKTINKINNNYYIGVHTTSNLNDSYLGCGHWRGRKLSNNTNSPIINAFRKYGDINFIREVMFIFDNREDALLKERDLVDICDDKCYNARTGGGENYKYTREARSKMSSQAKLRSEKIKLQGELLKKRSENIRGKTYVEIYGEVRAREISSKRSKSLAGRKCSLEHRQKMSKNRKGKDCGKCKGRKKVWDSINNKLIRLFEEDIKILIEEGKIVNEFKKIAKFHNVYFVKIKE